MGKPIAEDREIVLQIEGRGKTKDQALGAAFSGIKKVVGGTPLRIEPLDVEILEATENQYTERFMLFFFKRIRSEYLLRLNVRVRVFDFHLEDIEFEVKADHSLFR